VEVCPEQGISLNGDGVVTDLSRCTGCGSCVAVCVSEASEIVGEETSAADLAQLIQRDRVFYDESGGGVTFSGGEPMVQVRFLEAVMAAVHTMGIQTALDTSGYAHWEAFLKVLPFTDLVLFDIKLLDDQKHTQFTGVSNQLILDNLQKLNQQGKKIWLRFPVIPGINDDPDNLTAIVNLAKKYPHIERLSLLPYHTAAVKKYEGLGLHYCLDDIESPSETRMDELAEWFQKSGLPAVVGG
jgi:pyruvate formate lyase activating enzyme